MSYYLDFFLLTAIPAAAIATMPIAAAAPVPGFFVEESLVALELVSLFELESAFELVSAVLSASDVLSASLVISDSEVLSLSDSLSLSLSSGGAIVNVALSLTPMT